MDRMRSAEEEQNWRDVTAARRDVARSVGGQKECDEGGGDIGVEGEV